MKLDMVGIIVEDMNKALQFYTDLGFEISESFGDDYVELNNKGTRISLNTQAMIEVVYGFKPQLKGERIELAFVLDIPSEVDQLIDNMSNLGYEIYKEPWDAPWGQRYAIIKDIDGNLLSLFSNLS